MASLSSFRKDDFSGGPVDSNQSTANRIERESLSAERCALLVDELKLGACFRKAQTKQHGIIVTGYEEVISKLSPARQQPEG